MRKTIGSIILTYLALTGPSLAGFQFYPDPSNPRGDGFYTCQMKDAVSISDDGTLERNTLVLDSTFEAYEFFTFDVASGQFKTDSEILNWVILRPGDSSWDLIAHIPGGDPSFNIIRMSVWADPVTFTMTNGGKLLSGVCRKN